MNYNAIISVDASCLWVRELSTIRAEELYQLGISDEDIERLTVNGRPAIGRIVSQDYLHFKILFVGVAICANIILYSVPKFAEENYIIDSRDNHQLLAASIGAIRMLAHHRVSGFEMLEIDENVEESHWLTMAQFLVNDFLAHGIYSTTTSITREGVSGDIDWDETFDRSNVVLQRGRPIYTTLYSADSRDNSQTLTSHIHLAVITEIVHTIKEVDPLQVLEITVPLHLPPHYSLPDLGPRPRLLAILQSELRRQFESRRINLIKTLISYLECTLDQITSHQGQMELPILQKPDAKTFRLNSFFTGIGGFELGFEPAGFTTAIQCEIDPYCRDVLAAHWPDVERFDDISKIRAEDLPEADVWVGGFPCQDVSVARGKSARLGLNGARSGLFHTFADLVKERMPSVVVLENVSGLLSSNKGRDFGLILQQMTELGYSIAWRTLNSRYFGVPQSRPRVYIVCWKESLLGATRSLFETEKVSSPRNQRHEFIEIGTKPGSYPVVPKISYCLAATSGRHTGTDWSRTYVVCSEGVRRMTPVEYERLQGFPDGWTIPNNASNYTDIDTARYKSVGNAVSVPVIRWIASRISAQLSDSTPNQAITHDDIQVTFPALSKSIWEKNYLTDIDFTDPSGEWKWKNSGVATAGSVLQDTTPPAPVEPVVTNLGDLVEREPQNQRYYLTPNAAEGIIRRCTNQGRTLFQPLDEALRLLAKN